MTLIIDREKIANTARLLNNANNIVIVSHANADGDAVGSTLGMFHLLNKNLEPSANRTIAMILPNGCPKSFRFLPQANDILSADTQMDLCMERFAAADLVIGVDFNNDYRIGCLSQSLVDSKAHKILIDHHLYPQESLFDVTISYPDMSSASELVYWVAFNIWGNDALCYEAARSLYTGTMTDTGSYSFSCESDTLYEALAAFIQFPINAAEVHNLVFNTWSVDRMRFLGFCISSRCRIFADEGFAYFYTTQDDADQYGVTSADAEGIVNYGLMMEDIEVAAYVKQMDGKIRISLRSKKDFDVQKFASQYFDGGGHIKASGATSHYNFEETVNLLESNLRKELAEHRRNNTK